jgi:hypothetical protein
MLRRRAVPDLSFRVGDVAAMPYAAVPTLAVRLRIANAVPEEPIQSILLNCQVQIEPLGRGYSDREEARLLDLFGEREGWSRTMKPLHWMNSVITVSPFQNETAVDLPLPCSLDFNVAATKYFYGLEQGSIAVDVMFSGTVFFAGSQGSMQFALIPWDREARFSLPVEAWRQAIDSHYGDSLWLQLGRETFDRLYRRKVARGIPMWDAVIDQLLDRAEEAGEFEPLREKAGLEGSGR